MGFFIGNAQHIGARQQQQDAFGFSDPADAAFVAHGGFLGIVADGVGGLTHGSEASQSAVKAFIAAYHRKTPRESIPEALSRSLREANAAVLRVASEPSGEGAGTTLAAAVLHDHSLHWISAGDSRIYLLHDGRLTQITADHIYARQLDEQAAQGIISRAAAQENSERGSLTSYLGQPEPKEVDKNARSLALAPNDSVIVCSDGFYRALDDSEIVGAFQTDFQQACELLVDQGVAKQRKGQDNMTVIALRQSGTRTILLGRDHRARQVALASVLLLVALIAVWDRYRQEPHPASTAAPTQPVPASTAPATHRESGGTNADAATKKIPPPAKTPPAQSKKAAATKTPGHVPPQSPRKSTAKAQTSSTKTNGPATKAQPSVASPKPGSQSQNTPEGAPPPTSAVTQPPATTAQPSPVASPQPGSQSQNTPESAPPPTAPVTQPPATDQTPASPPAESSEKRVPPATTPANNPEKPPTTPPPATDKKPNGPSNMALEETPGPTFGTQSEGDLGVKLKRRLETKDGDQLCRS